MKPFSFSKRSTAVVLGVLAGAGGSVPAAHAGPFIAPQRVIDPIADAGPANLDIADGGAAALALLGRTTTGSESTNRRAFVAVHEPGVLPSAALPRGFRLAEPVSPDGQYVISTKAGIDAAGNATVVYWVGANANDFGAKIYARYRPVGGTWTAPQFISDQAFVSNTTNVTPELTVAPNGRAVLLTDAGLWDRKPGATTFTATPNTSTIRHIAMNDDGNAAAVLVTPNAAVPELADVKLVVRGAGTSKFVGATPGTLDNPPVLGQINVTDEVDRTALAISKTGWVALGWIGQDTGGYPSQYYGDAKNDFGAQITYRIPGGSFYKGYAGTDTVSTRPVLENFAPKVIEDSASTLLTSWTQETGGDGAPYERRELALPGTLTNPPLAPNFAYRGASTGTLGQGIGLLGATQDGVVQAQVRARSAVAYGPTQTVIAPTGTERYAAGAVALDEQGNGYVAWTRAYPAVGNTPAKYLVGLSGYDPVAPKITSVAATPGAAGTATTFVAAATDRMSNPTFTWVFGDGTPNGTGATVAHTYKKAGTYTAKVTARDEAGNTASWNKTVVVSAAG